MFINYLGIATRQDMSREGLIDMLMSFFSDGYTQGNEGPYMPAECADMMHLTPEERELCNNGSLTFDACLRNHLNKMSEQPEIEVVKAAYNVYTQQLFASGDANVVKLQVAPGDLNNPPETVLAVAYAIASDM